LELNKGIIESDLNHNY